MTKEELDKLKKTLSSRISEIDFELSKIGLENPIVKGDFNVVVDDIGSSQEDTAQEAMELDRQQALVTALENERKEIRSTLDKIEAGTYGKCDTCSTEISPARLKAIYTASLCISCANKRVN